MLKLIIEDDEGRKTVVPFVRDEITIGRQEGNTIRLTERNVSRRHARLLRQNGHVVIEDLQSSYGIRVNGDRIAGLVQVGDGDLIQIGDYDLAIQAEQQPSPTVPIEDTSPTLGGGAVTATQPLLPPVQEAPLNPEDTLEAALGDAVAAELAKRQSTAVIRSDQVETNRRRTLVDIDPIEAPRLVVLNTDLAGREFPCSRSELKIGRTDDNDIAIDHRSLSRTHCKVVREDTGEWRVIDLQSANGLMVNGEPYAQVTLRPGDVVELGHVKLQFVAAGEPSPMTVAGTGVTQETRAVRPRRPLLPLGVGAGLLLLLGAGYLVLSRPSKPAAAGEPSATRPGDGEAARRQVAARLAQARTAIEALDWPRAEALLKETRGEGGAVAPEAQALLGQLEAEKGYKTALEEAARALEQGKEVEARALLETAAPTTLLATRYRDLEGKRALLAADAVPRKVAAAAAAAAPPKRDPTLGKVDEAQVLYDESRELMRAQQLDAAVVRLERCVKIAPLFYNCYKALGSAHAKIASRDNSEAERTKGRKYYERYLELAPPDDKDVARVRKILEQAAAEQPQ